MKGKSIWSPVTTGSIGGDGGVARAFRCVRIQSVSDSPSRLAAAFHARSSPKNGLMWRSPLERAATNTVCTTRVPSCQCASERDIQGRHG